MKSPKLARVWRLALLALLPFAFASAVQAQQQGRELSVSFINVTAAHDSARASVPAAPAVSGDTLRYTLTFTNIRNHSIQNVVFDNPLPRGITLIGGTVTTSSPATVEYSIDNGATYSVRPVVRLQENGRTVERPAPVESYTHIRWRITSPIAPSATVTARYDARVGPR